MLRRRRWGGRVSILRDTSNRLIGCSSPNITACFFFFFFWFLSNAPGPIHSDIISVFLGGRPSTLPPPPALPQTNPTVVIYPQGLQLKPGFAVIGRNCSDKARYQQEEGWATTMHPRSKRISPACSCISQHIFSLGMASDLRRERTCATTKY